MTKTSRNGTRNQMMLTPPSPSRKAARLKPAVLAGAEMSRTSSISPIRQATVALATTANGSLDPWNSGVNQPEYQATTNPATNPRYMAVPPSIGVGRSWRRRASGSINKPVA